ncbi:TetR/AcrR family transcriptional regulator [Amycolatopsis arida]|uniref:TetR/AcrR family transcriptional regulator n=1 Tax=Amycolatopsis arida TaxID=587909 RepID=UPI001416FFEC|nr:TetR/AcrR family transcriptional regulator C-terminal domain-containing protein [Amycolatopsis arida]
MSDTSPTRGLRLLWLGDTVPRRGPRPALRLERVVRAAIEIADAEGLPALSMRKVADRLAVGTMSLYTYVPAKTDLVALMLDAVDAEGVLPHTVGGSWRTKVETWAREDWALYHRHEWVLDASARRPLGPHSLCRYDSALRSLTGIGLPAAAVVAATEAIDGYIRGMARRSVETRRRERNSGVGEAEWWAEHQALLRTYAGAEEFPTIHALDAEGAFDGAGDTFEFGLRRLLDGIAGQLGAS